MSSKQDLWNISQPKLNSRIVDLILMAPKPIARCLDIHVSEDYSVSNVFLSSLWNIIQKPPNLLPNILCVPIKGPLHSKLESRDWLARVARRRRAFKRERERERGAAGHRAEGAKVREGQLGFFPFFPGRRENFCLFFVLPKNWILTEIAKNTFQKKFNRSFSL